VLSYDDIRFELADGVATITLHRPDALNAFSGKMGQELGDAYTRCDQDDDVRCVVLTGAGRAFCAGADMTSREETFAKQDDSEFSASAFQPPAFELRKPVIAAVNGHAIGLGLTIALQADLRIIAREGKYGVVQVRRGVMPDAYANWTLQRIVGIERAAEILLTGRRMSGDEAFSMGIASRCVPADEVLPAALEIARDIAVHTAPVSVAITKKLLWQSPMLSPAQTEALETVMHNHIMGKDDAIEGVMAYIERRDPQWKLRLSSDWPDWPEV